MDDRGTSGNYRSKQSFSYEEDDYFAVSDRRNSRSKTQNQFQSKALEKVRSAFTSRSYVNHGERAERANRSRSSRADHSEHTERVSQRNATKRWDADNRGERNFRADRANRSESVGRSDRTNRSDNTVRSRSVGRSDNAGRPESANRLNNDGRMSRADRAHRADIRHRETYRDSNAESLRQENSRNRIAGSLQRSRSARDASVDASQRRRNSASLRSSYGRASDYARHADNDPRQDFELGDGCQSRRRRGEFSDPDGGQIGRMSYSERGERDRRGERYPRGERHSRYYDEYDASSESGYASHASRRGRHSEPEVYVRSGSGRGIFGGGPSLPFGLCGYGTGYRGGHAAGGGSLFSALPLPVLYALPVVVLILIIVLLVFVVSSVQSCSSGGEQEQIEVQEVQPVNLSYQASVTGLDSVADSGSSIAGFTLANEGQNYMPSLSEEGLNTIQTALTPFMENEYDVGFILMDLQTGSGYSYNLDQEVYGASSFKGPVLIYGCQEALEPGILSIDTVNDSASNAIIYSDNNSYYNMRAIFEEYSEISLVSWLANMNIDSDVENDTSFPHYSVRESAKLWMNAYLYFTSSESDPEIVSWAQDLFSQTEVSMLRAGVDSSFALITDGGEVYINQTTQTDQGDDQANSEENTDQSGDQSNSDQQSNDQQSNDQSSDQSANQQEGTSSGLSAADMATSGSSIVVYDKAGWLNGETDDGLCDAGIVYDGDKAYLISVMTGAPDGDGTREDVARLVAALWSQRSTLAPSEGYVLVEPTTSSSTDQSQNAENQG